MTRAGPRSSAGGVVPNGCHGMVPGGQMACLWPIVLLDFFVEFQSSRTKKVKNGIPWGGH